MPMDGPDLAVGTTQTIDFVISPEDQRAFAQVSGDTNPIHLDAAYALSRGFSAPVVYGGLLVAKLSQVIGLTLPGPAGLWSGLQIDFRQPLLVGQAASLTAEIGQVSEATRTIVVRTTIRSGERTIATGRAMATLFEA